MPDNEETNPFGNPIQDLRSEHAGIYHMLEILGVVSEKLKKEEDIPIDHLTRMHEFLKSFADRCHHGKEEDILFPELMKNLKHAKLINQLMGEHKSGRDLIHGIGDSLSNYRPGSADATHIAVNMDEYRRLLVTHIVTENEKLFPAANAELSQAMKNELAERFEDLERNVIGLGRHEEFHGWLKEFKGIYLD